MPFFCNNAQQQQSNSLATGMTYPSPPLGTFNYTVQPGDSLNWIARKFNTTVSILKRFNTIPEGGHVFCGQTFIIPNSPYEAVIHTVNEGDTIFSISRKFRTFPQYIMTYNYLDNPNSIKPGEKLVIPTPFRFNYFGSLWKIPCLFR